MRIVEDYVVRMHAEIAYRQAREARAEARKEDSCDYLKGYKQGLSLAYRLMGNALRKSLRTAKIMNERDKR